MTEEITMTLTEGMKVYSAEHEGCIGFVKEVNDKGAKIDWAAPVSKLLPYGAINLEWWPVADWNLLTVIDEPTQPTPLPEPTAISVYQAIVNEIKTHWTNANATVEYPGCVHISPSHGFGICYVLGDVNETWGADVYTDTVAMESGEIAGSFDLEIPRENLDAVAIVKALLAGAEAFENRHLQGIADALNAGVTPRIQAFKDAQTAFLCAAEALSRAWGSMDQENHTQSTAFADKYPFAHSFDEVVEEIRVWVENR